MKLVVLSSPAEWVSNELDSLEKIAKTQVARIHFRKPMLSNTAIAALLDSFSPTLLAKTVVHINETSDLTVFERYPVKGFHLKEALRKSSSAIQWVDQLPSKEQLIFSTSAHSISELDRLPLWITHSFLSPIFNSISKEGYGENLSFQADFHQLIPPETRTKVEITALGGIDLSTLSIVRNWKYPAAAVLGTVWNDKATPIEAVKMLLR